MTSVYVNRQHDQRVNKSVDQDHVRSREARLIWSNINRIWARAIQTCPQKQVHR